MSIATEPMAVPALDLKAQRGIADVVLVSHDTDFVAELAPDRAMIMPEGEMRFFDQELLDLVALA